MVWPDVEQDCGKCGGKLIAKVPQGPPVAKPDPAALTPGRVILILDLVGAATGAIVGGMLGGVSGALVGAAVGWIVVWALPGFSG